MEIDFLGLSSPKYGMEQQGSEDEYTDGASGGVETSLSLSTSCSTDCYRETLSSSQKKKSKSLAYYNHGNLPRTEQPGVVLLARPVFVPSSTPGGFLYDLNNSPAGLRNVVSKLPSEAAASLTMLYSSCSNVFNGTSPEQADKAVYVAGNVSAAEVSGSARAPTSGYTPTVAMARRATLARFLEKRLHRINQTRKSHLMGKSLYPANSEAPPAAITARSNKQRTNDSNLISL